MSSINGGSSRSLASSVASSSMSINSTRSASTNRANNRPTTQRSISLQPSNNKPRSTNGVPPPSRAVGPSRNRINGTSNGMSHSSSSASLRHNGASSSSLAAMANNNGFHRSLSANADMNDPAVQARIGNRATKVVNKSIGNCGACNRPINDDGCTAFGKVYHKACFKCSVCKQRIQGKFFEKDGKPVCQKDFMKSMETCCVCNGPIKGDSVVSNTKVFHPECMRCYVCGDSLRGQYFTWEDKPICEMHYKQHADKCSVCGEVPNGKYFNIDDNIFCEDCHKGNSPTCPKCGEDVLEKMVKITGAVFHNSCFTCVGCKKNMSHAQFVADDKMNIFCPDCYNKKRAPRCSFCKKPIVPKEGERTAPRLRAMDRDFHPQCFQCEDCGLVLDSRVKGRECWPFKNHILCFKCNRKKLSSSEDDESSDNEE